MERKLPKHFHLWFHVWVVLKGLLDINIKALLCKTWCFYKYKYNLHLHHCPGKDSENMNQTQYAATTGLSHASGSIEMDSF